LRLREIKLAVSVSTIASELNRTSVQVKLTFSIQY